MLACVGAIALRGLEPRPVRVECSVSNGLPGTRVVGSPDTAVREAAERAKSAVERSGFSWPNTRVTINLAPAALRKTGAGFDLSIALGTMGGSEQLESRIFERLWAFGELGLDGATRAVPGTLAVARAVRTLGGRLMLPAAAAGEAALVEGLELLPVRDLREAVEILTGQARPRPVDVPEVTLEPWPTDLAEIRGQELGRRALELTAAGGHHLLLVGPPGCGKSMLAERLPSVLEPLDIDTALEVAAVQSIAGARDPQAPLALRPPFNAPHHSISQSGLIGGGSGLARPGAVSLAHRGVLFLDELLEFPRTVLDALRQPLERGEVRLVRSAGAVRYPCAVQLVAATNPCPCGHLGSSKRGCRCRPDQIERYRGRLSGPLLDRLDIQVELRPVDRSRLLGPAAGESSAEVARRVAEARAVAHDRWGRRRVNARVGSERVRDTASPAAMRELAAAVDGLGLSARGFDRVLRVSRTVADLAGHELITADDVAEAVGYQLPTTLVPA